MRETNDFDAFYAATSRRLVGQVYAMTGDLSEAEDTVQEAYTRAWHRWPSISGYQDPEAWLRTVAFRITVNSWRKAKNRLTAHLRSSRNSELSGLSPDLVALVSALRKIPEAQRRVIVLHYLVDLSIDQIALEVGVPTGTVKARLARGRRALAPLVSEFDDDGPRHRARVGAVPQRSAEFHKTSPDREAPIHA
jgi:RNA polymerase sigma-70 factor (sigma-E family)